MSRRLTLGVFPFFYLEICSVTVMTQGHGQSELPGKQHRSNRCEASAACEDNHLHRHEDMLISSKLHYEWQRLCWFTE